MNSKVKTKSTLHSPVFSKRNKISRIVWLCAYFILFRLSPTPMFAYRRLLLRFFGANLAKGALVYPSVNVWLPSNLTLGEGSTLGPNVTVYNQARITIGGNVIVSQNAHLCASTHDYNDPLHPLILSPVTINDNVWICDGAFIGPNVLLSEGCVVGARAVVMKSTKAWGVYAGNPAKLLKMRHQLINE